MDIIPISKAAADFDAQWRKYSGDKIANEPPYCVEPHGKGYAIYHGRDNFHHGLNLGYLTECNEHTVKLIQDALNYYVTKDNIKSTE